MDSAEKLHFVPGLCRNDEEKLEHRVKATSNGINQAKNIPGLK
jgi:hypothetical protein